jgi:hypothetical protein
MKDPKGKSDIMMVNLPDTLTKREMFAMAAMQGMLANPDNIGVSLKYTAEHAVSYADELISELEK